ncbi:MAG: DUF4115 domain-containing protein [Limimaricola sp.]|uniref:helix-turn-helix domain-containing protein n=1 Tax=Limimaricola sp. TaxID=2211665 RepID=UPI001D8361F3|nr:helix-turn-helix domain-containing protein [Limimaricola sp.]MBI1418413.1 DUF4115 domain-containing protein [Limimaricola sp.]
MIGKGFRRNQAVEEAQAKGFDDFELRLGDLMRGERATMGKSLLDVQRELKIKAAYIAAIENADPTAFDTPGFIAGYVRSYARYLGMDPDDAFGKFCMESGFATAHGMSAAASSVKPSREERLDNGLGKDIFTASATPFVPGREALLSGVEPRALGSIAVLIALISGLGYGGWMVLQQVQQVQVAPVEQSPTVVSQIDPLAGGAVTADGPGTAVVAAATPADSLDRLYRPQALAVPVMVPRDGPIAAIDPAATGTLSSPPVDQGAVNAALADALGASSGDTPAVQVTEPAAPGVQLIAVRPAWVRVKAADGTVLYEGIMNAGDSYDVPPTQDPATLRVGDSGSVYFDINGKHYGPVGARGMVTSNVALTPDALTQRFAVADISRDSDLAKVVAVAEAQTGQ